MSPMSPLLPVRRPDVLADSLPDGSAVLYDPHSEQVYAISSTAAWVWEACDGAQAIESLVSRMLDSFDTDQETVVHDIDVFLQDLRKSRLVGEAEDDSA